MAELDRDELDGSVKILRRVHKSQVTRTNDGLDVRPDSSCFKDQRGESVSAYRADLLGPDLSVAVDALLDGYDSHGVVSLEADLLRSKGFRISDDVDSDDPDCGHAHVLIVGSKPHPLRIELAELSTWERRPPPKRGEE